MPDAGFDWDDDKAARNSRDHGVTFEMARDAFRDIFATEWTDARQYPNEQRYGLIGMVEGRLLFVAYTIRDQRGPHHFGPQGRTS